MSMHLSPAWALLSLALAAACSPGEASQARSSQVTPAVRESLAQAALPIADAPADYEPLLAAIGDARFVALGEATHGTHEFYRERARISERLIRERGFGAVVIEGDWPDTERVNRYVRGLGADRSAAEALGGYTRFPRWMWRNAEFGEFVESLRAHNRPLPPERRVGVYGIDIYNLFGAADAVIAYLEQAGGATRARAHYRCFAPFRADPHRYGTAARGPRRSCETAAASVLAELRQMPRPTAPDAAEAHFSAIRSAASVAGAEAYFRTLYAGSNAWNVRDQRMAQNVDEIAAHAAALSGTPGKVVIWAHNSHVGDARATDAALRGELNLGQLLRTRHQASTFLLGFLTYEGTAIAADAWDAPGRVRTLKPAVPESDAGLLHAAGIGNALLLLRGAAAKPLAGRRLQRAVGVIYLPATERQSHYFPAELARQFDALIYLDRTRALTPLR